MESLPDVSRYFHPVMPARKLGQRPVRAQIAGRAYALFRDGSGRAGALLDACPHRHAPLSRGRVRDGRLECSYHGWNFDIEGRGRSPSQPSLTKCDVSAFQVIERHGYLWVAAADVALSTFPDLGLDEYEPAGSFTQLFEAPLHVVLDNFSEDEHTPWVHTRLGWSAPDAPRVEFEARNFDDHTEVSYHAPQRPSVIAKALLLGPHDHFHNEWVTRFDPVRIVYDIYWTDPATGQKRPVSTRSAIFFVPETARTTRLHVLITARLLDPRYRVVLPLLKKAAVTLAWLEVADDRRFVPRLADTPFDLKGMRLGKFDKPIIQNHKLLRSIYWGERRAGGLHVVTGAEG